MESSNAVSQQNSHLGESDALGARAPHRNEFMEPHPVQLKQLGNIASRQTKMYKYALL
jgi:hypothetical protein